MSNDLPCSPSSRIRPEHFDNPQEIAFDSVAAYHHFKEQQTDLYEIMLEILQNAIDSTALDQPNKILVEIGTHPVPNPDVQPILRVTDEGEGITRLHDFDIYKFIRALKAKSAKANLERALGSKGIGMLQFPNIAENILITSMYKGIIVQVLMFENERGMLSFGDPVIKLQATDEDKEYYGMSKDGTKLEFFGRPKELDWIKGKGLATFFKTVQEEYAVRFAENLKLDVIIGKKKVQAPSWIKEHPPEVLWTNSKDHEVRGAIWEDEKGAGVIKMYRGHKIISPTVLMTKCTGYFENWDLKTSAPRTSFVEDREWFDTIKHLKEIMSKFPPVGQETDQKEFKSVHDYMMKVLNPPKVPTSYGGQTDNTKDDNTGDVNGADTTGYRKGKDPDPDREIKRRKKHDRDNENQTKIGSEGDDTVEKTSVKKSTRSENPLIEEGKNDYGPDRPLYLLFTDQKPWLLMCNIGNAEYELHKKMNKKDIRAYHVSINNWIAEAYAQAMGKITEEFRMELSTMRVEHWKADGYYPKVVVPPTEPLVVVREDDN